MKCKLYDARYTQLHEDQYKLYGGVYLFNLRGNGVRVTTGISSPALVGQQRRVKKLTSSRATHCSEVGKFSSKRKSNVLVNGIGM